MHKLRLLHFFIFIFNIAQASILPENNQTIPISDKQEGLTEAQYNFVINKVEAVYRPIIQRLGFTLTINRLWNDPRVNAGTTKKGKELILNMYGGYARHLLITEDAYALVMCHELGHHLGGLPKKIFESGETGWPSVEGQADYFATLKCLRKVFRQDQNEELVSRLSIPTIVSEKCSRAFTTKWEIAICIRTSIAGLTTSAISADIRQTVPPEIRTPDESIVLETFEAHPLPQCRLDTYFQGSLCEVSSARNLSSEDEAKGTCHQGLGHVEGLRPLCWYKSSK